jgi:hypothetical protein
MIGRHRIGDRVLVVRVERRIEVARVDVLEVGQLGLVDRHQLAALDQRLHRVRRRYHDVVALGTRSELCEQLLVVGVVGLHDLALAELLEPLDGLGSDVVVPVVEVQLVLGCRRGHGGDEQGKQHGESFHESLPVGLQNAGRAAWRGVDERQREQHQ